MADRAGGPEAGDEEGSGDTGRLALLLDAAEAVTGEGSHIDALRRLASRAVPELADICFVDLLLDDGMVARVAAAHADPSKRDLVNELAQWYPPATSGPHPGFRVIATGQPDWAGELTDDFLRAATRSERHFELLKALGFSSYMAVPLAAGGETFGSVTFVSAGSGRRFGEKDLALPMELVSRVATVVAAARSRDREHRIATDLQARLLPRSLPWLPGLDMAASFTTAGIEARVGGDFYDVVVLPSGRLGVCVGDIAGHDADAAALMGQLRAAVRVLAGQIREPAPLVDALQWSWDLLGFDRIATAVFARIDTQKELLSAVSSGHPPPLLVGRDGRASYLPLVPQPPLGCPGPPASGLVVPFPSGTTMLVYTDGLVERRNVAIEDGLAQLAEVVTEVADRSASELCDIVMERMTGAGRQDDDAALLVVKFLG